VIRSDPEIKFTKIGSRKNPSADFKHPFKNKEIPSGATAFAFWKINAVPL
jgi:hypothetical protein